MFSMKKYIPTVIRFGFLVVLIVLLIVFNNLKNNPTFCENFTSNFSRYFVGLMSAITSWIPFSLTEVLFVTLFLSIILLFVLLIVFLVKKKYIAAINRVFDGALLIFLSFNLYFASCECAYNRDEMPLPYYENEVLRTEHVSIYNYFANDVNACINELEFDENGDVKTSMSLKDIANEVKKAYAIIEGQDYYYSSFGGVKPMLSSFVYREFQITGVTYSPLGEANIDVLNTNSDIPLTVAHELAHTKGVMREDDANQLAFYVCLNSEHPYLRFSAYASYFYQLEAMTSSYYLTDEERGDLVKVKPIFYTTRSYVYKFWKEHDLLGDIGEWINNLYIKSSGVEEGTSSYSGGTEYIHDPTTSKLIPSLYQKLFFDKYYHS